MISDNSIRNILSLFLFVAVFVSLGFNDKVSEGGTPIHLSQLIFSALYLIYLISFGLIAVFTSKKIQFNYLIMICAFFMSIYASFGVIISGVPINELIKFIFLILSVWIFVILFSSYEINIEHLFNVILLGFLVASITFILEYDIFNIALDNRLDASRLGGYNTFAFLLSQAMIISIHIFITSRSISLKLVVIVIFMVFLLTTFLTLSRGGLFSFLIGATYYLTRMKRKRYLLLAPISALVVLSYYDLSLILEIEEISQRYLGDSGISDYSSGRIPLWIYLISDLLSNFLQLLFGNGIGTIFFDSSTSWTTTRSAHNQYLEYLYYFGLIIFIPFSIAILRFIYKIKKIPKTSTNILLTSLFIQILFGLLIDSHLQTAQVGWYFGMMIALILVTTKKYTS